MVGGKARIAALLHVLLIGGNSRDYRRGIFLNPLSAALPEFAEQQDNCHRDEQARNHDDRLSLTRAERVPGWDALPIAKHAANSAALAGGGLAAHHARQFLAPSPVGDEDC